MKKRRVFFFRAIALTLIVAVFVSGQALKQTALAELTGQEYSETLVPDTGHPEFEEYGLTADLEPGKTVSYITPCWEDISKLTNADLSVSYERDVDLAEYADEIALLEEWYDVEATEEPGYEWIRTEIRIVFLDENAAAYGVDPYVTTDDYYVLNKRTPETTDTLSEDQGFFTVWYQGGEYSNCLKLAGADYFWGSVEGYENAIGENDIVYYFRVPKGYDGLLVYFSSNLIKDPTPDGDYSQGTLRKEIQTLADIVRLEPNTHILQIK